MAVATSNLTHGNNVAGVSSVATASFTIPTNQLCLAMITTRVAAADPSHATISGWTEVLSVNYDNAGSQKRLTLLRFLGTGSTGTATIDFAAQVQSDIVWVIDTFTGMDTTGVNGAGAIVQTASNIDLTGTGTTISATLAAFSSVNNATYGACAIGNKTLTFTPGTGFTMTGEDEAALNGVHGDSEFRNTNSTAVGFSSSVAGELAVIALEIKAAAVTAFFNQNRKLMGVGM